MTSISSPEISGAEQHKTLYKNTLKEKSRARAASMVFFFFFSSTSLANTEVSGLSTSSLPAVVQPEPFFGIATDIFFDGSRVAAGQLLNVFPGKREV